jgi:hypothetical protein
MKNKERNEPAHFAQTKGCINLSLGGFYMAKRKAEFNAVEKYSKTPHKNVQESEFSAEFTDNNNAIRFQNRNSKQGKKGRS